MTERCAAEIHDRDCEYGVITVRCVRPAGHTALHAGVGLFGQHVIGNSIGEVLNAGRWS